MTRGGIKKSLTAECPRCKKLRDAAVMHATGICVFCFFHEPGWISADGKMYEDGGISDAM